MLYLRRTNYESGWTSARFIFVLKYTWILFCVYFKCFTIQFDTSLFSNINGNNFFEIALNCFPPLASTRKSFRSSASGEDKNQFFDPISAGQTDLEDSITLRARNPGTTKLTNDQVPQMLQKADFEGHGFRKEESHTLLSVRKFPANSSTYMTNIFYYKEVDCSQAKQVLMEAEKILPGKEGCQY